MSHLPGGLTRFPMVAVQVHGNQATWTQDDLPSFFTSLHITSCDDIMWYISRALPSWMYNVIEELCTFAVCIQSFNFERCLIMFPTVSVMVWCFFSFFSDSCIQNIYLTWTLYTKYISSRNVQYYLNQLICRSELLLISKIKRCHIINQ